MSGSPQNALVEEKMTSFDTISWQTAFDALLDAVWIMDIDQRIMRSNKATEQIFGLSAEQAVGRLCCGIASHGSDQCPQCPFEMMMKTKQRAYMENMYKGRWYEVSIDPVISPEGVLIGAVHIVSDITERKQFELKLTESEARMNALLAAIPDAILFKDGDGRWLIANNAARELYNASDIEFTDKTDYELAGIIPNRNKELINSHESDAATWESKKTTRSEELFSYKDNVPHYLDIIKVPIFKADNSRHGLVVIGRDVSERRILEEQIIQQQKLEGIGLMAGGIAHDFNNLLTPIFGYADMLLADKNLDPKLHHKISTIKESASKAKDLVRQLLTFSRKQIIKTQSHDLNEIISSFLAILRRTIRENIGLEQINNSDVCRIKADRTQLEQILLNLAVNAQDAIVGNGTLRIETAHVVLDDEYSFHHPGSRPGRYVMLAFSDNGCGMDDTTLSHIFEPFYTTKAVGHGTGLGLSTVYGIVKQHEGYIDVQSTPGRGSIFCIYLPEDVSDPAHGQADKSNDIFCLQSSATILLAEDNEIVLEMVRELLTSHGHTVFAALLPEDAITIAQAHAEQIDLLISDAVMPQMNGPELHERIKEIIPDLKVLFMSGYASNMTVHNGNLKEGINFIEKPFTTDKLLERVTELLQHH